MFKMPTMWLSDSQSRSPGQFLQSYEQRTQSFEHTLTIHLYDRDWCGLLLRR